MHNISISVNGSKFHGWKHDFLEKSVGGCSYYHVIPPWPDQTRSKFSSEVMQMMPNKLWKISARSAQQFDGHFRKTHGRVALSPPPLHWQKLMVKTQRHLSANHQFSMTIFIHYNGRPPRSCAELGASLRRVRAGLCQTQRTRNCTNLLSPPKQNILFTFSSHLVFSDSSSFVKLLSLVGHFLGFLG